MSLAAIRRGGRPSIAADDGRVPASAKKTMHGKDLPQKA
ncbi:hypothetical protein F8B43_3519 [Methylorubrum populi]|uniref:Uncharacterized protein n=1 Tax=Methylorubrum populi TaxID=223967 RepID=A0A833MXU9_9HYPH|nr:hypothetical protein F8B43_3519 [Methylorubrum populi]